MTKKTSRYKKVAEAVWTDDKFKQLSPLPPCGQALWLFLLTSPLGCEIPGVYYMAGKGSIGEWLNWEAQDLEQAMKELEELALIKTDWDKKLIYLPNACKYNRPESLNVVRYWAMAWPSVPNCSLKKEIYLNIENVLAGIGEDKSFLNEFYKNFTVPGNDPKSNSTYEIPSFLGQSVRMRSNFSAPNRSDPKTVEKQILSSDTNNNMGLHNAPKPNDKTSVKPSDNAQFSQSCEQALTSLDQNVSGYSHEVMRGAEGAERSLTAKALDSLGFDNSIKPSAKANGKASSNHIAVNIYEKINREREHAEGLVSTSEAERGRETGASPSAQPPTARSSGSLEQNEKDSPQQQRAFAGMEFQAVGPSDPLAEDLRSCQTARGVRMPIDFAVPESWIIHAMKARPDLSVEQIRSIGEKFKHHWVSVSGKDGLKLNWLATWMNWVKSERNLGSASDKASRTSKIIEPSHFDNDKTQRETLALVQRYGAKLVGAGGTGSIAKKKI